MLQLLVIFVAPSDCSESVQTTGRIRVHMEGDDVEQCRASSNRKWERLRQTPKSAGAAPPSTGSNAVASWPAAPTFNFFPTFPANPTRTYELVSKQRVRISFESYVILLKCERLISTTSESTPSPRAQVVHRAPFCLYCLEELNLTLPLPQIWNHHNVKRRGL